MSVFASLGILILSMLILMSLKLIPGIFMLFTHYNLGKFSKLKVDDLGIFFILGVETLSAIIFILINSTLRALSFSEIIFDNQIFSYILAGIMIALGFVILLFYFRKGNGTKLFISRKAARNFDLKAKTVKNRSDAFILGFIAGVPELIFTLPLYLISLIEISKLSFPNLPFSTLIFIFVLILAFPLMILHTIEKNNHNLAELVKTRFKNKNFFRLFISILYFLIAILIIAFGVII